ncbi:hypothetical protein E4T56_gene16714 [Termitomyces sp. T112]|nr:hypothetical protein E4T56_gene16714 [Termitomyces sp. T112]
MLRAHPGTRRSVLGSLFNSIFHMLRFDSGHRIPVNRRTVQLIVCGESYSTNLDICLLSEIDHDFFIHLIVEEDYSHNFREVELVAKAIAAAQANNAARWNQGLPRKDMLIPAMMMNGMQPAFYRIPVSLELADGVMGGNYPAHETIIQRCTTYSEKKNLYDPEFRKLAFKHFLLFRDVVNSVMDH